nr:ATP-dependent DNA helicase hus2/rqh1-like [Crassostrea gigas]
MALRKKGLRVCMLNTEGTKGLSYKLDNSSSDEDEGDDKEVVPKFVQLPAIQDGNVDLLYAHPEALFTGKAMSKILRSDKYQKRLGAIVVDEVHIVTQW